LKIKNISLILLALILIFLVGCSNNKEPEEGIEEEKLTGVEGEDKEEEATEEAGEESSGNRSPLSGRVVEEELLNRPVVGVMFDNHPNARPQAGFYDAEVIYEFFVEGRATRYLAFFLMNDPEMIGPVRSARPYYLEKAMEYDAVYAHAGASSRVTEEIAASGIQNVSLLGPGSSAFRREPHRKAPHNAYTDMDSLRSTAEGLNYRESSDFEGFLFHHAKTAPENGEAAEVFEVRYHASYLAEYRYDEVKQGYQRYYVGEQQYDETHRDDDQKPIIATNVLVQIVPARQIPGSSSGVLEMDTIGSGKGYYFTMGQRIEVLWEKNSNQDFTRYHDLDGEEIHLNPGQTWVQVISNEEQLTIKNRE
jgi:hypothetical protein